MPSPRSHLARRGGWALAGFGCIGFAGALIVGRRLYPLGSLNHDEPMYVFQARLLAHGHLTLPASFAPYRPWASGVRNGHLVMKYTPVWPAVLAIGKVFGSMRVGAGLAAAGAVVFAGLLAREMFGRWREALLAAMVLVCSPLFFLQSGTYLPYVFQLALATAIVWLVVGAVREDAGSRRMRVRLVIAGVVWGLALFARQFDAVLLVIPLVVAAVIASRREPRRLLVWAGWSALGAAVPVMALLVYNAALMGNPLRNTFTITGPNDALGFGTRGVFTSSSFPFKAADARMSVERNLVQLPGWTFGGLLLVVAAGYGVWRSRKHTFAVWALGGIAVSFTVGYAFFWSPYSIVKLWPGARMLGPFYHLALLIPLVVFGAAGIGALFDRGRALGAVVVVAFAVVTAFGTVTRVDRNRHVTDAYRSVDRLVDDAHLGRAVLFLGDRGEAGFQSAAPFLENTPTLSHQKVVYAVENGPGDLDVLTQFPDRAGARLRSELRPGDQLLSPTRFIEPVHVARGRAVTLHFRIVNTVGTPTVMTRLDLGDNANQSMTLDTASHKGETYNVTWTLTTETSKTSAPNVVAVPPASGTATVEADFVSATGKIEYYERQYPYIAGANGLAVLTPGIGRYYFQYTSSVWLNQDVTPQLAEVP